MNNPRMWILAAALPLTAACASTGTGGGTGAGGASTAARSSLPTVQCPAGVTATRTAYADTAQQLLARAMLPNISGKEAMYQRVLQQSQAGIAADPGNPHHHFFAGQAQIALGNFAAADSAFSRAESLCSGYATEILPERQRAFQAAYTQGVQAYEQKDTATALASWTRATQIYNREADAFFNLAILRSGRGEHEQALAAYNQALAALQRPASDTSATGRQEREETRQRVQGGMLNLGVQFFQAKNFAQAAQVFSTLTRLSPNNRDAWYNHALALYQAERWNDLIPVAQRVIQMDPLNQNANIILFNAHKSANQNDQALRVLQATDALPVYTTNIQLVPGEGRTVLRGQVEGNKARAGSPVRMEFTFHGPNGPLGTQQVTVNAPAKGASTSFEVALQNPTPAVSYSYRVLQ